MKLLKRNKYESPAYWTRLVQLSLHDNIERYLEDNGLSRKDFANQIGVSKGYVSQILNADYDHKLSKLVELALACRMVPKIEFLPVEYAEEIARNCYLQPADWKRSPSYNNVITYDSCAVAQSDTGSKTGKILKTSLTLRIEESSWMSERDSDPNMIA